MKLFADDKPFYKANFHVHTTCSDGKKTPEEVKDIYRKGGYDVLALTDHWYTADTEGVEDGLLIMRGNELEAILPTQVVHIVALGLPAGADAKPLKGRGAQEMINWIRGQGARAVLAHPAWSLNTPDVISGLRGFSAVEIYNSVSGVPWNGARADSSTLLDMTFASRGMSLPFVASDDSHWYTGEACMSCTMLQADSLTREGILDALDRGAFFASQGPCFRNVEVADGKVRVTCSPVSTVVFYSNTFWSAQRVFSGEDVTEAVYEIEPRDRRMRVELIDAQGRHAWCSWFEL